MDFGHGRLNRGKDAPKNIIQQNPRQNNPGIVINFGYSTRLRNRVSPVSPVRMRLRSVMNSPTASEAW